MPSVFRALITVVLLCASALPRSLFAQTSTTASVPASAAALLQPLGLAFDSAGTLYIADSAGNLIRSLDLAGNVTTVAGTGTQGFSGDGGPALAAMLDAPHAIVSDASGNLYLADTHNARIRRIDVLTHQISTVAGTGTEGFSGDGGPAAKAQLFSPTALALDPAGHLFVADSGNQRIRKLDLVTGLIATVAGTGTQGYTGDGGLATLAALNTPSGLALDGSGTLYIADTGNHVVRRVDATTGLITTLPLDQASAASLRRPAGLAVSPAGLLIADASSHRIFLIAPSSSSLAVVAGQGTEAFAGDNALATSAMLDSPAALAVSPAGLLTIADTGNQRIRQITPAGTITTIAGLGTLAAGTLSLTGASVQTYGSAVLAATLSSGTGSPSGPLSLVETAAGSSTLVAQGIVASGTVRFDLSHLPAGTHRLLASYPGDSLYRAAQSQVLNLRIAPKTITATLPTATVLFGQPLPPLTGSLTGLLPPDTTAVAVAITSAASLGSPPGSYALTATLSGPAAGDYTLAPATGTLTIAKAPASLAIGWSNGLISTRVTSTTSGEPTGAVTLLTSAGTQLSSVPLSSGGTAVLSSSTLANGTYTLTAVYSGDANFLPAQSSPLPFTIGPPVTPPDFSLAPSGATSQTVNAGEAAQFTFAFKTSGSSSLAGPVVLSTNGLPSTALATFDPSLIPPGGAVSAVTLTVTTPRTLSATRFSRTHARALLAFLLVPLALVGSSRRRSLFASLATLALCGCGARINAAATAGQPAPQTYTITVTGTTTNLDGSVLQHTANVTLTVQP